MKEQIKQRHKKKQKEKESKQSTAKIEKKDKHKCCCLESIDGLISLQILLF